MSQPTRRYYTARSTRSRDSESSESSQESQSTAPTSLLFSSPSPSIHYHDDKYGLSPGAALCPRSSTETYNSSVDEEELYEEPEEYDPEYEVPEYRWTSMPEIGPQSQMKAAHVCGIPKS